MAGLVGKNVAVPLRTPCLSDVWITYTARGRSRHNAIARLRPTPEPKVAYPELSYLAHAVLGQACKDAAPEKSHKINPRYTPRLSRERLCVQIVALLWLCSDDDDLHYWADLAEYPVQHLHHEYLPILERFCRAHREIALKYALPRYALDWCLPPRICA